MKHSFSLILLFLIKLNAWSQIGLPVQQSILPKNSLFVNYDFSKSTSYTRGSVIVNNIAGASTGNANVVNAPNFMNSLGYISFNGSNQYIVTGNLKSFFKSVNSTVQKAFTISFWFYPTTSNGVLVSELDNQTPSTGWHASNIELINSVINFRVWNSFTPVTSSSILLNQWHYVAMVYDGASFKGYLDGVLQGTQTFVREIPSASQNYAVGAGEVTSIGAGAYGTFNLAQFKLFNLPLSDNDILQEYNLRKNELDYTVHSPSTNTSPTYWSVSSAWNSTTGSTGASDAFGADHYRPWLNSALGWAAQTLDANQYITLSYDEPAYVKGVVIQPRASSGNQYLTKVHVETSTTGAAPWTRVLTDQVISTSITDDASILFSSSIFTKAVKVIPVTYVNHITARLGMLVKPNNVLPGLALNLDAANLKSYQGAGTTWTDLSGSSNNGTFSNITYSSANGGILSFNGTSSQVTIPDNASIEPGSNDWTMEVWVNPATNNTYQVILGKYTNGTSLTDVSYGIRINNGILYANYSDGTNSILTTNYTATINQWYHLVYVFRTGTTKNIQTFINGVLTYTDAHTLNSILNTSNGIILGNYNSANARYFNGKLAIVRLYNRALTSTEVLNNFNANRNRFGL